MTYPFQLSIGESHWLARALGYGKLPLPAGSLRVLSDPEAKDQLDRALNSLRTRGLVRPMSGGGWMADRLPAALVRWMAEAAAYLRVESIAREGAPRCAHLFTAGEQGLFVETDGHDVSFLLFEARTQLVEKTFKWLELSKLEKAKGDQILFQPMIFVPAAWKDPQLAERMLKIAGENTSARKKTLAWVAALQRILACRQIGNVPQGHKMTRQTVLCTDGIALWSATGDPNAIFEFDSVAVSELPAIIRRMLWDMEEA